MAKKILGKKKLGPQKITIKKNLVLENLWSTIYGFGASMSDMSYSCDAKNGQKGYHHTTWVNTEKYQGMFINIWKNLTILGII